MVKLFIERGLKWQHIKVLAATSIYSLFFLLHTIVAAQKNHPVSRMVLYIACRKNYDLMVLSELPVGAVGGAVLVESTVVLVAGAETSVSGLVVVSSVSPVFSEPPHAAKLKDMIANKVTNFFMIFCLLLKPLIPGLTKSNP